MSDIYFDKIKDLIKSELKIHIDQYKDSYIARRVSVRMRLTKCKGYREYLELLKKTPEEYEKLENTLTVNVTEFWRDITVYREIKKIFEEKVKDSRVKSIKIWSAGCSSGEEPYGLAIILKELCEQYSRKFLRITINATDLDKEIVRKARQGIYIDKQFKNMDEDTINKYFTKIDRNHYQISSDIKKMVTFKNHDLIKEPPIYEMDFILCRNVIIYFGKEIQEILFNKYYEGLSDGGYLILGRTEMLHGEPREMFIPHNHRERIYQKIVGKNKRMGQNSTESSSVSVKNNQDIVKNTNTQSRLKSSEVKSSLKSTANTRSTRSTRSSVDNSSNIRSNIRSNSKNNNESTNRLNSSAKTTNRLTSKTKSTIKSTDKPVSRLSRYSSKNEVKSDKEERTKRTLTSSTTSSSRLIKKDTKDNDRTNKDRLKSRTEVKRTGISSKTSESESSRTLREKTRLTTRENINKDKEKRESKTVKKSSSLLSTKKKEQDSPKDLKEIRKSLQSLRNSKK
ncbi:CheR family methyltransferase [Methanococcus voltae]|uniref:protein-glutamate O-methyltransferase n=1 Tax=Methanococcus voltae TaxID=2188 RepID=A0A8J7RLI0_METVO|nr:chemotaxis protein methyltransferase CheR [Methanococcus voltae]MBP2201021.1 chemotaxis protein methyltransferase CheR [Methanococcus voltae]